MGWAPKEALLGNVTIDEMALILAVLIAPYPIPESYSSARKSSSQEGQMGSMPLALQ